MFARSASGGPCLWHGRPEEDDAPGRKRLRCALLDRQTKSVLFSPSKSKEQRVKEKRQREWADVQTLPSAECETRSHPISLKQNHPIFHHVHLPTACHWKRVCRFPRRVSPSPSVRQRGSLWTQLFLMQDSSIVSPGQGTYDMGVGHDHCQNSPLVLTFFSPSLCTEIMDHKCLEALFTFPYGCFRFPSPERAGRALRDLQLQSARAR